MSGSVRIPISADASSVNSAFDQIRSAIRRAGQEGRSFADLDLSHPELARFSADLARIQDQFDRLRRTAVGATGAAVRRLGATDVMGWYAQHGTQFPEDSARARHEATVGRYVLAGTQFAPAAGGGMVPAPPPAGVPAPPAPAPYAGPTSTWAKIGGASPV